MKRKLPEQGEYVIGIIKKIFDYGAICELIEYDNLEAFIPIREVASGWVKNIHEFIKEGQRVVCQVIHVNPEMRTIDASIKRVTEIAKKKKLEEYAAEKRAVNFLDMIAKKLNIESSKVEEIKSKILSKYNSLYDLFSDAYNDTPTFKALDIPEEIKKEIKEKAEDVLSEKVFELTFKLTLQTFDTKKGIEKINNAIKFLKEKGFNVTYISAPNYQLTISTKNPQSIEKQIPKLIQKLEQEFDTVTFEKVKV